jgi:hypothetical protein
MDDLITDEMIEAAAKAWSLNVKEASDRGLSHFLIADAVRAALAAALPMIRAGAEVDKEAAEPQPIETAPAGTWVRVFGGVRSDYGWDFYVPMPEFQVAIFHDDEWRFASFDSGHYGRYEKPPTYWEPLPAGTKEESRG